MLLVSRENYSTNCSAVRERNFYTLEKMNEVMSKCILFLDHCRTLPWISFCNLRTQTIFNLHSFQPNFYEYWPGNMWLTVWQGIGSGANPDPELQCVATLSSKVKNIWKGVTNPIHHTVQINNGLDDMRRALNTWHSCSSLWIDSEIYLILPWVK